MLTALTLFVLSGLSPLAPPRRTTTAQLVEAPQRTVLSNGLVVLLSPDLTASSVVVDLSFHAGTVYEPSGKSGLAHLVEHLMASGSTPEADFMHLAAQRGATDFNAFTSFDTMTFHLTVPPEQLPFALWVNEERLGSRAARLDQAELDRQRRIVLAERASNVEDQAYAPAETQMYKAVFGAEHPLSHAVIGTEAMLDAVTVADVQAFAANLAPSNGVLVIAGHFDAPLALEWVKKTLGRLPPGKPATRPELAPPDKRNAVFEVNEGRSRRPRVSFAWNLAGLLPTDVDVLEFGALLLRVYTDGAFGMSVDTAHVPYLGDQGYFRFDVTFDHGVSRQQAQDNAEGLFRYLTRAIIDDELFGMTLLAWDRAQLGQLDNVGARAHLLSEVAIRLGEIQNVQGFSERHWQLTPEFVQAVTRKLLDGGRRSIHARPLDPLPLRGPRE